MSDTIKLAVIPGDGTGPEVTAEACKILEAVAPLEDFTYERVEFDYGGDRYLASGEVITEQQIDELRQFDAIYLGAIGHPEVKPGILEKGLLLSIRFQLDQYINLRPVKLYPGVDCPLKDKGPEHIRFDVVRENTEDLYCGAGGFLRQGTAGLFSFSGVAPARGVPYQRRCNRGESNVPTKSRSTRYQLDGCTFSVSSNLTSPRFVSRCSV